MDDDKLFALVTGASSGIGLAISRELARHGYPILLISNEEEKLKIAGLEIEEQYHVRAIPLFMDLAKKDSAKSIFDFCEQSNIKIEILVNNAGMFIFKDIIDTAPERMEAIINLHTLTPALLARLFAAQIIREKRKAYILNMSSISARMHIPGITLYSATKNFLRSFSLAMGKETRGQNISITTISPGAAATGFYGLGPRYMKLGIKLGIIVTPEILARKSVRKMFRKRLEFIPNPFINHFIVFITKVLPNSFFRKIKMKLDSYTG